MSKIICAVALAGLLLSAKIASADTNFDPYSLTNNTSSDSSTTTSTAPAVTTPSTRPPISPTP